MKTIAVALQKGGTGKTTTTATLSHALALAGYQVLAVDLDPQGNLALAFGLDLAPGLYDWLNDGQALARCVVEARPRLDLLPGDRSTAKLKENLTGEMFREQVLARALEGAPYDFVFLDCAPSVDVLSVAALVAADWVIMPVEMSYLATVGLAHHLEGLVELQELGYGCQLKMVIPTFCDRVTRESAEILRQLRDAFGDVVTDPIPRSVRLREAPAHGKTILEYAPRVAVAYQDAVRRLVNGL